LPDDRVVDRTTTRPVPDDRRLALVRHSDGRDVASAHLVQPGADDLLRALPDLERVVLDPARLRVNLLVLLLIDRDHLAAVVEDHEARAGRSLIDRCCVLRHAALLSRP
jgi:hypothetical protein